MLKSLFAIPKKYGQRFVVSLIPGDGIGEEVCRVVQKVFDAANVPIDWDEVHVSGHEEIGAISSDEDRLQAILESIRRNRVALKGSSLS